MGGKLVSNCTSTMLPRTDTIVPILAGAVESSMRIVGQASMVGRLLIPGGRFCTEQYVQGAASTASMRGSALMTSRLADTV
jgi:hypothetical protein